MNHHSHPGITKRLARAEGHLRKVIAMIDEGRPCIEIAPQLHAVEKAISSAKTEFIRDHIDHCLDATTKEGMRVFGQELKSITKYL